MRQWVTKCNQSERGVNRMTIRERGGMQIPEGI